MWDVFDPAFAPLVVQQPLERLATGFRFTEGPVWDGRDGSLVFSDILGNTTYRWREGRVFVERHPSRMANGLSLRAGMLLACEHAGRCVSLGRDGTWTPIATHYQGRRLNSPNDVIVRSDGTVYFTDPTFGLTADFGVEAPQELPFQGVYRLTVDDGALTLLIDDLRQPNGLAFSPDESVLYVDDSETNEVRAFPVLPDGSLGPGRRFAALDADLGSGVADGLKVDEYGNVYVAGPGGISAFNVEGRPLGHLRVPEVAANLAWGGVDGHTLWITASTSLYRIETHVTGAGRAGRKEHS